MRGTDGVPKHHPWWKQGQRRSCRKGNGSAAAKQIPGANTRFGGFDASERSYPERGGAADSCVLAADVSICRSGPPNRAEMRRQFDQLETPTRGNFSGPLTTLLPDHCFAVTLLVRIVAVEPPSISGARHPCPSPPSIHPCFRGHLQTYHVRSHSSLLKSRINRGCVGRLV